MKHNEIQDIEITTEFIKLDQFLKFAAVVESGGIAKELIKDEQITVNNDICTMRGKKLYNGDIIEALGQKLRVVIQK